MIQLARDPFGRTTLVRVVDNVNPWSVSYTCTWCGQPRQRAGKPLSLFRYGTASDNGRIEWHRGSFCSKTCHDAYYVA